MTLVMFYEQDVMGKRSLVASVMALLILRGTLLPSASGIIISVD